jgi:C4-dicarboxylate-specific signal transduction histidine kinase
MASVEVILGLEENLPEIMADKIRLEQVFLNIINNAVQAMEESETRRLTVNTRLEPSADHPVIIEILDTGKGFSEAESEKLYTPFFSTKEPGKGTGLGLSISLRIVKDHDGQLKAEGKPDGGARFVIGFPLPGENGNREEASDRE